MLNERDSQREGGNGRREHERCTGWVPVITDFETVDAEGKRLVLHNVPAENCVECGRVSISADDALRVEQAQIAADLGINALEGNVLLYLHAPVDALTGGYGVVREKYRLNKMLFYQWAELDKLGFGQSRVHDNFLNDKRGPVPEHLNETTESLEKKGLINVQWGGKEAARPYAYELTDKGRVLAKRLWTKTPEPVRGVVAKSKTELYLLDRHQIKDKVHSEYPRFRKTYAEA